MYNVYAGIIVDGYDAVIQTKTKTATNINTNTELYELSLFETCLLGDRYVAAYVCET